MKVALYVEEHLNWYKVKYYFVKQGVIDSIFFKVGRICYVGRICHIGRICHVGLICYVGGICHAGYILHADDRKRMPSG